MVGSKAHEGDVEFETTYTSLFNNKISDKIFEDEGRYIVPTKKNGKYLIGAKKTALVIPTKDRPTDLFKTYNRLSSVLQKSKYSVDLFISQEGKDSLTQTTIENIGKKAKADLPFCTFTVINYQSVKTDIDSSYLQQSSHYYNIMNELMKLKYDQVILLEVEFLPFLQ